MSFLSKIGKGLNKVATLGAGKTIFNSLFGKKKGSSNDNEANSLLNTNVENAKDTANKLESLGIKQAQDASKLREMLMQGLNQQKQNIQPMLDNVNKEFNQARDNQNAYLASIGYRPDTNKVFNSANAELESQRNNTLTGVQNQANQQYFNNLLHGLNLSSGLNNNIYGGQMNALLQGQGLKQGALNAQTAYLTNKYQANLQNQANKNSGLLGLLGTLGGALIGGPIGAGAGGFLSGLFNRR